MSKFYDRLFDLILFSAAPALISFMPTMMAPRDDVLLLGPGMGLTVALAVMYVEILRLRKRLDKMQNKNA